MSAEKIIAQAQKHDLAHLEERVRSLDSLLNSVAGSGELGELITIIHRPGWTTLPEHAFVLEALEGLVGLAEQVAQRKRALVAISRLVGRTASDPMPA